MAANTRALAGSESAADWQARVAAGWAGGVAASLCRSVGLVAGVTWAAGLNAALFALDKVSPVGTRPILVAIGLVVGPCMVCRGNASGWARWNELGRHGYDLTKAVLDQPEPLIQRRAVSRRLVSALRSTFGGNVALAGPPGSA